MELSVPLPPVHSRACKLSLQDVPGSLALERGKCLGAVYGRNTPLGTISYLYQEHFPTCQSWFCHGLHEPAYR